MTTERDYDLLVHQGTPKLDRDEYCEEHGADTLMFLSEEYLDQAVIGVSTNQNVIYDGNMIIELLVNNNPEMTWEDAIDHYEYNIVGPTANSNGQNGQPIIVNLDKGEK